MPLLIYIHGFNSSPASFKAKTLARWLSDHQIDVTYQVPHLSPYPAEALHQLEVLLDQHQSQPCCLLGSSLGGFFATNLVERYGYRAVLINPAVAPHELIQEYLGENRNLHTGQRYLLQAEHADQLRAMAVNRFQHPERYWVLLQAGDETLDFRLAAKKYYRSACVIEQGGDHSFVHFERWIPAILDFFDII